MTPMLMIGCRFAVQTVIPLLYRYGCCGLRHIYSFILYLMLPGELLRLWRRGARVPGYRRHWGERFGFIAAAQTRRTLWIHAVSVGEVRAAEPLVRALRRRWPDRDITVTTTTPTGRETVESVFGSAVRCMYLPYDLPGAVRRFLQRLSPSVALVMETEIWPNLYHALRARNIPLLLVNARVSESSLRRYRMLGGLARASLRCARHIAAQGEPDAERFLALGADRQRVSVTGNLKFDSTLPHDFDERVAEVREKLATDRPIWIAGSTHPGEEEQLLEAQRRVLDRVPDALLIVVPRHPERAGQVLSLCERAGFGFRLYSQLTGVRAGESLVIVDVLGVLAALYAVAGVAFIGGSLVHSGGHNPLEALLAGTAVVSGLRVENFRLIYQDMLEQGAVSMVETAADLADTVSGWFSDELSRQAVVTAGRSLIEQRRGAVVRTMELLDSVLD